MKFKASMDNLAKGVTAAISVLFAVIIVAQLFLYRSGSPITAIITTILILIIYVVSYLFRPTGYELTDENFIIHRAIKDVVIKKASIREVILPSSEQMRWTIRTFGVGGLFGYYGKFVNWKLGNMTWYATRRNKIILIMTADGKKLVITPDETEKFLRQFA